MVTFTMILTVVFTKQYKTKNNTSLSIRSQKKKGRIIVRQNIVYNVHSTNNVHVASDAKNFDVYKITLIRKIELRISIAHRNLSSLIT